MESLVTTAAAIPGEGNVSNFWSELPRPFLILAPMEAVTDVVFRHVVAKAAPPDVWFTEFTNATGWAAAGDKAIGGRLIKTDDESPIVAQLWGADPASMEKLARHCAELGYHGIDINMGCPDSSATKSGGGSAMILNPENAAAMIAAAKTSGLPVSVKTRLGYSKIDEWRGWLTHILQHDVVNLTIHLRTKKEMSKVPAHYELIPAIKQLRDEIAPQTLLTINGDIKDREHGEALVTEYGVDGVMIGRGIFANPYAFSIPQVSRSRQELLTLLHAQLDLHDHYDTQLPRKFDPLKRFFKIYVRDFEGAAELRDALMHTKTTAEVRQVLSSIA
jgi:tRNA-dihydrouridine synthase